MHWAEDPRVIFVRDFAYPRPPRRRLRTMTSAADIAHEPAHDYAELLSGPLVDIIVGVGDVKRQWSLHRNLLSYHSEYLASELQTNDATKNKTGNKLELPEDDPKGFELLVKWLYQGKLDDVSDKPTAESKYDYAVACHKLYMLCERFDMPNLKNMAIDQYRKGLSLAELVPDADEINEIYHKSPEGSPFRVLMTRIAARQIMDPDADRNAESYRECFAASPDFAIDLVNAIKSGSGGVLFVDPTRGDDCTYHDHEHGPNCYGKGKSKAGTDGAVKKPRIRPHSPPSPPRTPPEEASFKSPRTPASGARKPNRSPSKIDGPDTTDGANRHDDDNDDDNGGHHEFADGDAGDASPKSNAAAKSGRQSEHAIEFESPGRGSPKRQPPKLRRRGSTGASRHPASPGNI